MDETFFFYDLETTSFNPREGRILQFAGQRADSQLNVIGEPVNTLVKLTPEVLPDPDAILVNGITPQQTLKHGIPEIELVKLFQERISLPKTTFIGYNNVRFDDEFMRFLFYRNLYDPYDWAWRDGRSRWDLLDLVRMTRALRPDGISWPVDEDGKPSNRLTLLTAANKLAHQNAHDALSDAQATLDLARLIFSKQPKLFKFAFDHRDKKSVADLVLANKAFIYTSGKFSSEIYKTTIVQVVSQHPSRGGALVYDLRVDPEPFSKMSPEDLALSWQNSYENAGLSLPVKSLLFNRCPAVAPLSVLDQASIKRLKLDLKLIELNQKKLSKMTDFADKLIAAQVLLDKNQEKRIKAATPSLVDAQLYNSFFNDHDTRLMSVVHKMKPKELPSLDPAFEDKRLRELYPLFIARNYPKAMTKQIESIWINYCQRGLNLGGENSRFNEYLNRLDEINSLKLSSTQKKITKSLREWALVVKSNIDD